MGGGLVEELGAEAFSQAAAGAKANEGSGVGGTRIKASVQVASVAAGIAGGSMTALPFSAAVAFA